MIQKRMQRKAEEQKNTDFLYNGWEWPTEKIDRYRERYHREADRIRTVTLGSNFTVRIFCQVSFCQCKISGLELVFRVVDLDFRAIN